MGLTFDNAIQGRERERLVNFFFSPLIGYLINGGHWEGVHVGAPTWW